MSFAKAKKKSLKEMRDADRARAKRAALRALRKARAAAEKNGAKLSDWEGEFLGSVEQRVQAYGRAFADPEKGSMGASLSIRQAVKVKEIAAKAKGERKFGFGQRRGFRAHEKK
jgi:hypothetical protein